MDAQQLPQPVPGNGMPSNSAQYTGQLVAADTDLIEQEWVARLREAEDLVAISPAKFATAYGNVKAQYLQARYGKAIPSDQAGQADS